MQFCLANYNTRRHHNRGQLQSVQHVTCALEPVLSSTACAARHICTEAFAFSFQVAKAPTRHPSAPAMKPVLWKLLALYVCGSTFAPLQTPAGTAPTTESESEDPDLPPMPHAPPEEAESAVTSETEEVFSIPVLRHGDAPVLPEPQPAQGERPPRARGSVEATPPRMSSEQDRSTTASSSRATPLRSDHREQPRLAEAPTLPRHRAPGSHLRDDRPQRAPSDRDLLRDPPPQPQRDPAQRHRDAAAEPPRDVQKGRQDDSPLEHGHDDQPQREPDAPDLLHDSPPHRLHDPRHRQREEPEEPRLRSQRPEHQDPLRDPGPYQPPDARRPRPRQQILPQSTATPSAATTSMPAGPSSLMTPGRDSLQGALPQPLPQQLEPPLEQRPKQSGTTAARIGLARGLQPAYVAEYDPWHENGYISNHELGLPPTDYDPADRPEHGHAAPPLQPPSVTPMDPDSQMQTPTMDPWNFLAREYASHGPLLPPHLWQHNPLGPHQLHQAGPLNAHNGEMASSASTSTCAQEDAPPPPEPEQDIPPALPIRRDPARPVENIDAAAPQPDLPPRVQPQLPRREVHPSPPAMGQDEETDRGTKPDVHQDAEPAPEDEEEHSSDDSSSSGENLPQGARSSQKPRRAGHGSQRFKNKGQKSDVKSLWRQLGWGDKPPWLSWRRALPYIQKGERPPWQQPRRRPDHEPMLAALRNAQNYVRDSAGNVIPTSSTPPTGSSSTLPSSSTQPAPLHPVLPEPNNIDPSSKAHNAAAEDHERRQANNPYNIPPHLRPERTTVNRGTLPPDSAARPTNTLPATTPPAGTSTTVSPTRPSHGPAVRFQLPTGHREHPPKPARRKTILRKLSNSTTTQLQIDGLLGNPTIVIDNRPTYLIPSHERGTGETPQIVEEDQTEMAQTTPPTDSSTEWPPEHGEPLFFQPPAIRRALQARNATQPGSSTDPPPPQQRGEPSYGSSVPADIHDLEEEADQAAARGEAPLWRLNYTEEDNPMQSTVRSGANTQDMSWIWGAAPSTLPPNLPLDPHSVVSLRGSADGSWRGTVWKPMPGQTVFHPKRNNHEPTAVVFNTFSAHKDKGKTLAPGTRLTFRPVGQWMGPTKLGLSVAHTPKYWLVTVDDAAPVTTQDQGVIPLTTGDSFWLAWSQDGIWSRKPRFQNDLPHLGGPSTIPPTTLVRPPTPPQRRNRSSGDDRREPRHPRQHRQTPPARQHETPPQPAENAPREGRRHEPARPPPLPDEPQRRPGPSPGSESETSWPSEDNLDQDDGAMMQLTGGATSSTDPAPAPVAAGTSDQLDEIDRLLRALLQQSFLQPREDVTDLAYKACARLLQLRETLTRGNATPTMVNTLPDNTQLAVNPLAEAQLVLNHLLAQHGSMANGKLRLSLRQLEDYLAQAKRLVESMGAQSPSEKWQMARSGVRTSEGNLNALQLAVEEGGVAATQEAIEALLASVDRTALYIDHLVAQTTDMQRGDRPGKKRKGRQADYREHSELRSRESPPPQTARRLQHPPGLPAPPLGPVRPDSPDQEGEPRHPREGGQTLTGDATPFQILRAQQLLERLLPFLEQDTAAVVSEVHGLLFSWTTALWGSPILLVDNDTQHFVNVMDPGDIHTAPEPELDSPGQAVNVADSGEEPRPSMSQEATQIFWAPSPNDSAALLARQSSHRRRRLHAHFLGSQDGDPGDRQMED